MKAYNFLTVAHFTVNYVNKLCSSETFFILKVRTGQFEYRIFFWTPQTSLKSSKRAEVSFSIVPIFIIDYYFPCIALIICQHFPDIVIEYFIFIPILQKVICDFINLI